MNQQKFDKMNLDNNMYNEIQDLALAAKDWGIDAFHNCRANNLPTDRVSFARWEQSGFHTGDLQATQKHYVLRQQLYELIQRCAEYDDKMQPNSPWWEADALRKAVAQIRSEYGRKKPAPTYLEKLLSIACPITDVGKAAKKVIEHARMQGIATNDIAKWIDDSGGLIGVLRSIKNAA